MRNGACALGNRNSHGSSTRGISFMPGESTIQYQTEKIKMFAVAMSTTSTSKAVIAERSRDENRSSRWRDRPRALRPDPTAIHEVGCSHLLE